MDADAILKEALEDSGMAVWKADHDGKPCHDHHAIPKPDDLLPWLVDCPGSILWEVMGRALWIHQSFILAMPDAARSDPSFERHQPTARWLALGRALDLSLWWRTLRDLHRGGVTEDAGAITAAELAALYLAWRAVGNPDNPDRVSGWFNVDADGFAERFPGAVTEVAASEGYPGNLNPLNPLVRWWQARPSDPANRELVTVEVPGRFGDMPLRLARSPAALDLSINASIEAVELEALEVEGEPVAGRWPTVGTYYRRRVPAHVDRDRGQLAFPGMPGPRSLDGEPVADAILATASEYPLTGDERSPLRGDVVQVARLGFSLTGNVRVSDAQGAAWLGGGDTVANRSRWNDATETARALTWTINPKTRAWVDLANITRIDPETISIGVPGWWHGREHAWRLTAGLWRPAILGTVPARGAGADRTNALSRTLDGIESALSWTGRTRGTGGRIAVNLRPERKGGPGAPVFMPWRDVLTYSGEPVPDDADPMGSEGRRYRRRVQALKDAGYFCGPGGQAAPAGDSVEIVRDQRGSRWHEPGLWVRATARFVEAVAKSQRRGGWSHVPASRLLPGRR